ncbi:MAG: restriction endonuclease subunit S [Bacteroidetes bacterium]|nr:restriction endonuclease subunit S [Bacteroidota bacterium]
MQRYIIKDICQVISLKNKKIKQRDYKSLGKYPVIDQSQEDIGGFYNDETLVIQEEPPYIIFGDHTKIIKHIPFKFIAGADGVKVLKPKKHINDKYFYYALKSLKLPDKGYARHFQFLLKEEIPIPPLPEQAAIVAKIEEIFSELESGKRQLLKAQEQLKVYRQSLLKAAFEGKLTNDNLKEGELPEGWKWVKLENIATKITDGEHITPRRTSSGFLLLSARNIQNGYLALDNVDYVPEDEYLRIVKRCNPEPGDILISCSGTIGRVCNVPEHMKFVMVRSVALIKLDWVKYSSKFYEYLFQSPILQSQIEKSKKATAQANLFLGPIKNLNILVCSKEEQDIIALEIVNKFTVLEKMEETITQGLQQSEMLRQSILKRAFEGRLI